MNYSFLNRPHKSATGAPRDLSMEYDTKWNMTLNYSCIIK